jgi:hypothetical protein
MMIIIISDDDDDVKEGNVGISFSSKVFKIQRINLGMVTAARNKMRQCIVSFYFLVGTGPLCSCGDFILNENDR